MRFHNQLVGGLAAATLLAAAGHAMAVPCDKPTAQNAGPQLPGVVVYFTGSSAAKPMIKQVSVLLAKLPSPIRMIYQSVGSCQGLSDITTATKEPVTGTYWDEGNANVELSCTTPDIAGVVPDVGVSDVFAQSCNNVVIPAGQQDFTGSAQVFNFVTAPSSKENVISMEAAFVVYGFGGVATTVDPFVDPAYIMKRDPTKSGTYALLSKLIGLDGAKIKGTIPGAGKSPDILAAVHNADATKPNGTLGVLSSDYADANRAGMSAVKIMAYQHKGAACGLYPDSSKTSFDKLNVRNGTYPFWGPLHYVTQVDNKGVPVKGAVATALSYFTRAGLTDLTAQQAMIDYEVAAFTVPQCAMRVKRSSEVAPADTGLSAFMPAESCGCYYEAKASSVAPASCKVCKNDGDCGASKCRFGYCESK